jgi:hypothetical protein
MMMTLRGSDMGSCSVEDLLDEQILGARHSRQTARLAVR